jgi:hypothetical protein
MAWVWAVGIIVALLALTFASTARRDLVRVDVFDAEVTITPRGLNKLWAFRRELRVPLGPIREVKIVSGIRSLPMGLRAPGTAIPGLVLAGTYRKGGERSFYVLRDGRDMVVLELEGHDFARVAVQTRDPYEVVTRIHAGMDGSRQVSA